jgi:prophage regulatory protein
MPPIYITDRAFAARYGNHRTWPWRLLKTAPDFPKPICLSPGCTRWRLSDIEAWENAKSTPRRK